MINDSKKIKIVLKQGILQTNNISDLVCENVVNNILHYFSSHTSLYKLEVIKIKILKMPGNLSTKPITFNL